MIHGGRAVRGRGDYAVGADEGGIGGSDTENTDTDRKCGKKIAKMSSSAGRNGNERIREKNCRTPSPNIPSLETEGRDKNGYPDTRDILDD